MKELFEINKNLFKVGDNYVCVSEEEIKEGDFIYDSYNVYESSTRIKRVKSFTNALYQFYDGESRLRPTLKKIIFSTQFIHESIPVLNIENEEDITLHDLAFESFVDYKPFEITCDNYKDYARYGFKKGYQKAKETYKFTEEDLRRVFWAGSSYQDDLYQPWDNTPKNVDEFIQSLRQPKEIQSIEVEFEEDGDCEIIGREYINYSPIILPNGKVKCKVNYK